MALTRQFLLDLGLEKDVMQKVLDEHGETVKSTKLAAKEDTEEPLIKKIKQLEGEKAALEKQVKDAPGDGGDWKTKYDDEVIAHTATKDSYAAKEDETATIALVRKALADDKANPKAIDLLLKAIDFSTIKKKDGAIENWADVSKTVKEQYADFFGKVSQQGVDTGTPPAQDGTLNPFSKEHFSLQAQTDLFRTDPQSARAMAAAVGIKLLDN